jgi:nicotinamidase-related amidase
MNNTALVLVDPYNDFFAEDGKIYPLLREVAEAVDLHRHIRELLAAARSAGLTTVIAPHRRYRPGDAANWVHPGPTHRKFRDKELYAVSGKGGEWYPDFAPRAGDIVASEHWGMSGFAHTDLDQQLRQHGVRHIILAGLSAPGCVEGTGRWGMELSYDVTLVKDATASFSKEWMHAAVELNGPLYADVRTTADVIDAMLGEADRLVGQSQGVLARETGPLGRRRHPGQRLRNRVKRPHGRG